MKVVKQQKKKRISDYFRNCPVKWYDWCIFLALAAFCFLSFEMSDLYHTAGCSYGYLEGHFLDFYDYLAETGIRDDGTIGLHPSYLPLIYMLFAVWNIPMKLFGIVPHATEQLGFTAIMWAKAFPCLAYLASGIIVFKIGKKLGMCDETAKVTSYAYLTFPIGMFDQFIIGHYEIFGVICVLLGFYCWLDRKDLWFVIWFGLAVVLKYYAILIFIPLLLLREKNIWKILIRCIGVVIPAAFFILLYSGSATFKSYVFGIGSSGDNPTGYLTYCSYYTGYEGIYGTASVYVTILAFAFVCAYAYFKHADADSEKKYGLYLACLGMASFFCFTKWHPQWLMLVIPFWVLSAALHKDARIFPVLDMILMFLFVLFVVPAFAWITDECMLSNGIFKYILPGREVLTQYTMMDYLGVLDQNISFSLITALIGIYAVFKHPKYLTRDVSIASDNRMSFVRARYIAGLMVFIIPAMLCVIKSVING